MTRAIRLGFDMDGVIASIMPWWIYLLNRYYNENLKIEDITHWNLHEFCEFATPAQVYGFLDEPGFFRHLEPIQGACEAIDRFIEQGYDVSIITTTQSGQIDKHHWLKNHIKNWKQLKIYWVTGHKERIHCDVFVDDSISNLEAYQLEHPNSLVYCFDQHHNQAWKGPRVDNWSTLETLIEFYRDQRERREQIASA